MPEINDMNAMIISLHEAGVPEAEIIRRLCLKRYVVRNSIVFEQGRRAGVAEAKSVRAEVETAQLMVEPEKSAFGEDEKLIAEIARYLTATGKVPEKILREKYHVNGTVLYKYRAVAADRLQWGWVPEVADSDRQLSAV